MAESQESQMLTVVRVWAAVAWADGVIAPAEADGFRRLIDASSLSEAERATARGFLLERVELSEDSLAHLSNDARAGIYRAGCRMAMVDGLVAPSERALLDGVRRKLGIPDDIALQIEAQVPGFSR
ncbi:MAG: hypothetical protein R3B48_19380 [Kofleriaceae bacterium]